MRKQHLVIFFRSMYSALLGCLAVGAVIFASARLPLYDLSIHLVASPHTPPSLFEVVPMILVVLIAVCVVGVVVLGALLFKKKKLHTRDFCIALGLVLVVPISSYLLTHYYQSHERFIHVQGFLVDPLTKQQYSGVDAVVGDTALHIGQGSAVAFDAVGTKHGITLTHKDFYRRLILLPQAFSGKSSTIYLSASFFNTLVSVIDSESRGKYDRIYEQLPAELKSEKPMADYFTAYDPIFDVADLSDQEVVIASIIPKSELLVDGFSNRLHDAYEVTVYKHYRQATYILVADSTGVWHVVR